MGAIKEMLLDYKEEVEKWLEGSVNTRNHMEEELKKFNDRVSEAKEKIKEINELLGETKTVVVNNEQQSNEELARVIADKLNKQKQIREIKESLYKG